MRRSVKALSAVVSATALAVGAVGVAWADNVANNVGGSTAVVNVSAGTTATVAMRLNATAAPAGDPAGCDADGGNGKVTLTVQSDSYTGLKLKGQGGGNGTAGPVSFDVANCKQSKKFQFIIAAGTAAGTTYHISASATGGVSGSQYDVSNAGFTLVVRGSLTATTLSLAPASPSIVYGTATQTWTATLLAGSTAIAGRTINFNVGGSTATAVTNASGIATLNAPIGTTYPADSVAYDIDAAFNGDTTYAASTATGVFTITKANQAAMAITGPTSGSIGDTLPITYSGGSGTGDVTFGASGACSLAANGTDVVINGAGTCSLTGGKAADTNYNAVTATPRSFTVGKADQAALSITSPDSGTYGDLLDITTSGGTTAGAVTYDAAGSTACAIESGKLRITAGTGSCAITATMAGNTNYNPVTSASHPVTVGKAVPTLSVTGPDAGTFGQSYEITYSSSAGTGAVTFDAGSSTACEVVGTQVHITHGTGSCDLTATQAADGNYSQVTSSAHSVAPDKATATIDLSGLAADYDGNGHGATATTTPAGLSGVTITFNGGSDLPVDAGSYAVVASLSNDDYAADDATGTLVISPKTLTGAITADNKEYDGNDGAVVHGVALSGVVGSDVVNLVVGAGHFATDQAGDDITVTAGVSLSGADAANYALSSDTASTTADITKRTVTGSITAPDKTYDGTDSASAQAADPALDRVVEGDDVTLVVGTATFDDEDAGSHVVTAALSLSGADAGNYQLTSATAQTPASINPKQLSASMTADDKVYDGGTSATVHPTLGAGVVSPDVVTVSAFNAAFGDPNVGAGKSVTATLQLDGADSGNYVLPSSPYVASATAAITAKALTGSITASNKVYDGSAAASVSPVNPIPGVIGTDDVSLTASNGQFSDANVGTGKTVTATLGLTGAQADNYSLSSTSGSTTANITAKVLTGSITASNKVYDGTAAASVAPVNPIPGIVGTDAVTLTASNGQFSDANAGTGKTVTATLGLTGAKAGNYSLSSTSASTTADITKAVLTVTASSASVKKGDAVPTITPSYSGWVNGEGLSALTTQATCSTTYTPSSEVGSYPTSCTGLTAANYTPDYKDGAVTVSYKFAGFFQPVDNLPTLNRVKAGQAVPVKFSLGGNQGLDIFRAGSPTSQTVTCGANAPDDIESTVTAGNSSLNYDAATGQYNYVWKTDAKWAGTCRQLVVVFKDGTTQRANFSFTK